MSLGTNIQYLRKINKLTQEQFAERIEVSPQYVSDLERGVVGISIATLKRACIALAVSSDQILFGNVSENRIAAIEKRCHHLTDHDFSILMDIIQNFATAIENAHAVTINKQN